MSESIPTTEQLPLLPTEAIRDATVNMSGGLSSPELFDRWYAEEIRKAKADAWEEGWGNGNVYGLSKKPREENYINPYRQGENK